MKEICQISDSFLQGSVSLNAATSTVIASKKSDMIERLRQTCKAAKNGRWDERPFLVQKCCFLDNPNIIIDLLDLSHQQGHCAEPAYLLYVKTLRRPLTLLVMGVVIMFSIHQVQQRKREMEKAKGGAEETLDMHDAEKNPRKLR